MSQRYNHWTRRQFAITAGAVLAAPALSRAQATGLAAGEVVDRIKKNIGIPWNNATYRDTFKIGGPEARVHGIASTFMSTLDVLQRAHAAGMNLIISHEPTFWSDGDIVKDLGNDPLYKYKLDFAAKNNLAVWRFHDHWHAMKPDGIFLGWPCAPQKLFFGNRPTSSPGAQMKEHASRRKTPPQFLDGGSIGARGRLGFEVLPHPRPVCFCLISH